MIFQTNAVMTDTLLM